MGSRTPHLPLSSGIGARERSGMIAAASLQLRMIFSPDTAHQTLKASSYQRIAAAAEPPRLVGPVVRPYPPEYAR